MARPEQEHQEPKFKNFGEALRHYRETADERRRQRMAELDPNFDPDSAPTARTTALSTIASMAGYNPRTKTQIAPDADWVEVNGKYYYSISSGAYSEIEAGISIPKAAAPFFYAATRALGVIEFSPEWWNLAEHLYHSISAQKLGPLAEQIREHSRTRHGSTQ